MPPLRVATRPLSSRATLWRWTLGIAIVGIFVRIAAAWAQPVDEPFPPTPQADGSILISPQDFAVSVARRGYEYSRAYEEKILTLRGRIKMTGHLAMGWRDRSIKEVVSDRALYVDASITGRPNGMIVCITYYDRFSSGFVDTAIEDHIVRISGFYVGLTQDLPTLTNCLVETGHPDLAAAKAGLFGRAEELRQKRLMEIEKQQKGR